MFDHNFHRKEKKQIKIGETKPSEVRPGDFFLIRHLCLIQLLLHLNLIITCLLYRTFAFSKTATNKYLQGFLVDETRPKCRNTANLPTKNKVKGDLVTSKYM